MRGKGHPERRPAADHRPPLWSSAASTHAPDTRRPHIRNRSSSTSAEHLQKCTRQEWPGSIRARSRGCRYDNGHQGVFHNDHQTPAPAGTGRQVIWASRHSRRSHLGSYLGSAVERAPLPFSGLQRCEPVPKARRTPRRDPRYPVQYCGAGEGLWRAEVESSSGDGAACQAAHRVPLCEHPLRTGPCCAA